MDDKARGYETIMLVIKDKSEEGSRDGKTVDYYEAARIAYKNGYYMKRLLTQR